LDDALVDEGGDRARSEPLRHPGEPAEEDVELRARDAPPRLGRREARLLGLAVERVELGERRRDVLDVHAAADLAPEVVLSLPLASTIGRQPNLSFQRSGSSTIAEST